ncbi:hypothetical protein [Lentilactobacillus hilgardii]|uniref:hypothetical protein n=1 Tax=Lentilactobacillus hilgardii TaxID=1588 RepID=UPI0021A5E5FC|nr:hypothetical protein [Lentilactobacillus hilgardii]
MKKQLNQWLKQQIATNQTQKANHKKTLLFRITPLAGSSTNYNAKQTSKKSSPDPTLISVLRHTGSK